MKIQRIQTSDELPQFGHYSDDIFLDGYLWNFICKVKELGIKYNDPYFPQLHMKEFLSWLEQHFENRGPLPENWPNESRPTI